MINLPKWIWWLLALVIVIGIIIVTDFHGGANVGMAKKTISVGVQ